MTKSEFWNEMLGTYEPPRGHTNWYTSAPPSSVRIPAGVIGDYLDDTQKTLESISNRLMQIEERLSKLEAK